MLAKLENATDDETEVLLKVFAENEKVEGEELTQDELEDVVGGATYATSVAMIYQRYNRLSRKEKEKWKKKLKELINNVLKRKRVLMPF